MTAAEYKRVRIYEKVLTAWGLLDEVINHPDDGPVEELLPAHLSLRHYLQREQDHFEATVDTDGK